MLTISLSGHAQNSRLYEVYVARQLAPCPMTAGGIRCPVMPPPASSVETVSVACPTQVVPQIPRAAIKRGESGVVTATVKIEGGVVAEIISMTGPEIYYEAVASAFSQYRCTETGKAVVATQSFVFTVE